MLLIWLFVVVFAVVGVAGFLSVGRPSPGPTLPGLGSGLRERIQSAVLPRERKPAVAWEDILGLQDAKQRLETGVICHIKDCDSSRPIVPLRQGVLLYGPPGNGKTTLVTALAYHCQATCYQVDAATLTDPYHGNDSKLVRILFEEARHHQPAIIFIDEIDSILSAHSGVDTSADRQLKTQFMNEMNTIVEYKERIVVIGATNRQEDLDKAIRSRLKFEISLPNPDANARQAHIEQKLVELVRRLDNHDIAKVVKMTQGKGVRQIDELCVEASCLADREPLKIEHFIDAMKHFEPTQQEEAPGRRGETLSNQARESISSRSHQVEEHILTPTRSTFQVAGNYQQDFHAGQQQSSRALELAPPAGDMPQGFIPASSPSARLWATHHFKTGPLGLGWYETESYVPASSFGNGRAGYCFKTGSQGVGFYKER